MEEDKLPDLDTSLRIAAQVRLEKQHYERELRGLEIRAYSGVLEALRASGKPNAEKEGVIKTLRDYFNISEDRHKAEIRLMAFDSQLSLISKKINGYEFTEEWAFQAQRVYVPLGSQAFSIYKPKAGTSKQLVLRDPVPSGRYEDNGSTDSDSFSESELEILDNLIENSKANGWHPGKHKALTEPIAVDVGTGNEKEIEEIEQMKKNGKSPSKKVQQGPAKSPDITDVPRTQLRPVFQDEAKLTTTPGKRRGVKRKKVEELIIPPPPPLENSAKLTAKKLAEKSKNIIMIKKSSIRPKIAKVPSRRSSESKKVKESSSETSSADEGENGPMPPDESSRVMSPVFSEVIRTSVLARGKARGGRGRNSSIDKRRNNVLNSSSATKGGKSRPRTPNQKSAKFKISTPTSGSRRKSKLNEKIDYDEVLMDLDGNEMGKQRLPPQPPISGDEASRRLLFDNQTYEREDYKASEDCAVYTESLPVNYHEDMEQVTDGVFKRPLPPSKGPKPWEIKDARLNHYHQSQRSESISDENTDGNIINPMGNDGVQQQRSTQAFSPPQINNVNVNDLASPTTPPKLNDSPPSKKQRIKSPLVVNPNINSSTNKVPLPAPVFTTSLSSVNKKRNNNNNNNKPISVVDSLNLHLPTSATASSLAASSSNRRPGIATGGGCSMFSNSSALIAGARGTAPGILQQQRKAQPHILSNSKVQRSFLPVVNSNIATNNSVVNNIVPIGGAPISIAGPPSTMSTPVSATGHTVQLTASPIPISSMSSANPSSPLPFQSFPGAPPPGINISGGMPVGHLSRSAAGTNIIFVQKANGPTVSGDSEVPSNVVPIKTQPRAVILRRAQLPRQGNVMILDMQKNQLVSPVPGQAPPFLQTARVLNAPGELSLVNIQPSTSIRKSSPPMSLATTTTQVLNNISSIYAPQQIHQLQIQDSGETTLQVSNPESFMTLAQAPSQITPKSSSIINAPVQITTTAVAYHQVHTQENESISSSNAESGNDAGAPEGGNQDAQYAQIEAELMQMEQENFGEVVYEEEVTTEIVPLEDNETTQYIYTSETCANAEGEIFLLPQEPSSHNILSTSGSSTDTAPESETSFQNFESSESDPNRPVPITKVTLSPTGEVKMASEAISRALSLSKSSAKRLTFTTPISLSTAATLAETLANSNKTNSVPDTAVTTNSTQISIVPSIFQTTTTELNPTAVVIKADPSSTNSVHIGNSQPGIEFTLHNNEILQQP